MFIYESHIEAGWIVCDHCGARQFPIGKSTEIKNLIYLCRKGRGTDKHYMSVNVNSLEDLRREMMEKTKVNRNLIASLYSLKERLKRW